MAEWNQISGETMALALIKSEEEHSRLAAVRTLAAMNSKQLGTTLEELASDSSPLVRAAVAEIRGANCSS